MGALNLLVGATGFVGGHLVEYLFQQGEISKGTFRKGAHLKVLDTNGVQVMESDLLDHHSLHEAAEGVDTIFSMASPMPGEEEDFEKVNTEGVMNLLEVAQEMQVKAIVHLSTVDVYGFGARSVRAETPIEPDGEYQSAKAGAERVLLEFARRSPSPRVVIIRAAKAVGAREPTFVVPILQMIESGKVVVPRSHPMSWSHPRDIAQAMLKAAANSSLHTKTYLVKSFDSTAEDVARAVLTSERSTARLATEGAFTRSKVSQYASAQLKASLRFEDQASWAELGYKPEYDLGKTAEDIAQWHRREPWASEAS
ncbi:MAG: NAD-dependent epimerase/dehydratase family protein [Thaumarchaeota archaeon]|nr:NAD-dependent epimerase/dehydratase family protein [Nitrososphaerota archaeon]